MVAKSTAKTLGNKGATKSAPGSVSKKGKPATVATSKPVKTPVKPFAEAVLVGWLQDASIEVPAPVSSEFAPGEREVEFSVGMRQHDVKDGVRSELRGRTLIHAKGNVLALVEASFVTFTPANEASVPDLPQRLYGQLKPHLEQLLALAGYTPPLPATLDQIG